MNEVYGPLFTVDRAEAAQPEAAKARASSLSKQFVFDDQVHFVRDDYKWDGIVDLAKYAAAPGSAGRQRRAQRRAKRQPPERVEQPVGVHAVREDAAPRPSRR